MPKKSEYDKNKLDLAIKEVLSGSSYRRAAEKYGIPKSTIEFKIKNPGRKETCGPPPILNTKEERMLSEWIIDLAKKGFPRKADDIKTSVQKFLMVENRKNPFTNNKPGDGWMKAFLRRHPSISERTSEAVTSASSCVSERDIKKWFADIHSYLKEKKLDNILEDPTRIYNGDETGFQICPSTGKVYAAKGSKNVYTIERGASKENITVMFTFSASASICCPMIIYPYQRIPERIANSVNPEWGIGRSDNGWMTSVTFYEYIANVFHPYLIKNSVKLPVLLFVDGHKSHLTYELSVLSNQLQIEIIALYPNATRIMQPADVSVFRPIKIAWKNAVREWQAEHPDEVLNKMTFAPLLEKAVAVGIKPEYLVNGFRTCGLYPFNPNAIDYTKCLGEKNNLTISEIQKHGTEPITLDYSTFEKIVGSDKINQFRSLDAILEKENEDFTNLYKVWKHFGKSYADNDTNRDLNLMREESQQTVENNINSHPNLITPESLQNTINDLQEQPTRTSSANLEAEQISLPSTSTTNLMREESQQTVENSKNSHPNLITPESLQSTINTLQKKKTSSENVEAELISLPSTSSTTNNNLTVTKVSSPLLGTFLAMPNVPQRKGKRNIERFPFAISSKRYQDMYEKKRVLKEEQENIKNEKKRKREEKKVVTNKKSTQKCKICKTYIKTRGLFCDQCEFYFHKSCIPKKYKENIPDDEDGCDFVCHICYKIEDDDMDEECHNNYYDDDDINLYSMYKAHTD